MTTLVSVLQNRSFMTYDVPLGSCDAFAKQHELNVSVEETVPSQLLRSTVRTSVERPVDVFGLNSVYATVHLFCLL